MSSPLKRLREATDLSAYAFAKEAGVAGQYYHRLESGEIDMRVSTAVKLSRVLAKMLGRKVGAVLAELTQVDEQVAA